MPFDSSRRLTGSNLFFASTGAVLETVGVEVDEALLAGWHSRVARARTSLRWAETPRSIVARRHAKGTSLAVAAPLDQLFTATEINEWAFCAALFAANPASWSHLERALVEAAREAALHAPMPEGFSALSPVIDEQAALARFAKLSDIEAATRLRALMAAADSRGLSYLVDDALQIGRAHV